jgi:CO/xanthine dehydrogenase FAD-binding subunit
VPNLLALDASVELSSVAERRFVGLSDFITGNRRTARRPDELVTAVMVPQPASGTRATFLKLGARKYLVISIVMVAAAIAPAADGAVASAAIAVGACSAVAQRLTALERELVGRQLSPELIDLVAPSHLAPLAPIDDVRGTAAYRRDATLTLLRRAVAELAWSHA